MKRSKAEFARMFANMPGGREVAEEYSKTFAASDKAWASIVAAAERFHCDPAGFVAILKAAMECELGLGNWDLIQPHEIADERQELVDRLKSIYSRLIKNADAEPAAVKAMLILLDGVVAGAR